MAVNDQVLRAHFASKKIFRKVTVSIKGMPPFYVSGAGAACFLGCLALVLGASLRTGAAFAATFLRSK